jgi:hypothetical protein
MSVIYQMGIDYVGIAQIILGSFSIIAAIIAIWYTSKSIKQQQIHNQKSVKPIPNVQVISSINGIELNLQNRGIGPMIIKEIVYKYEDKKFYEIDKLFDEIGVNIDGMAFGLPFKSTILPNQKEELLKFSVDQSNSKFISKLDDITKIIAKMEIKVLYCDIYDIDNFFSCKTII